jgi:uncharacterized membrane protein YukC
VKKMLSKKTCLGIFAGVSFIGVIGLIIAVILLVIFVLFVCFGLAQVLDVMTKSIDDQPTGAGFFDETAGWDYKRIALIEPYHAINTNDNERWVIESTVASADPLSSTSATKLNVIDSKYIVAYAPNAVLGDKRFDKVWFVIIPDENIKEGFTNEEDFLTYLKGKGINSPPNLTNVNELYQELRNKGYLEWFPEEYKE